MNIFFTADHHFFHKNIIKFCDRPFENVEEMNERLILNWNGRIRENDLVYVLGDMVWEGNEQDIQNLLNRLQGKIIYIPSQEWTHEKVITWPYAKRFMQISPLLTIKHFGIYITLCHYCLRTWPKSHYNHWHLYAHSHGNLNPIGKSWDSGVDNNNFMPLSLDEIKSIMENRPDNPNLIKDKRK